jgi:hypothetical protein
VFFWKFIVKAKQISWNGFEDDRIRILDGTGVELILGDVNTDKDGKL